MRVDCKASQTEAIPINIYILPLMTNFSHGLKYTLKNLNAWVELTMAIQIPSNLKSSQNQLQVSISA